MYLEVRKVDEGAFKGFRISDGFLRKTTRNLASGWNKSRREKKTENDR